MVSMSDQVENLRYKKGGAIIHEGEIGDCAFILESGAAEVYKSLPSGEQQFLGALGQGDIFGELRLIDGLPRSANVRALGSCRVRKLTQGTFELLVKHNPKALMPILKILVNRLRHTLRLLDKLKNKQGTAETMSVGSL